MQPHPHTTGHKPDNLATAAVRIFDTTLRDGEQTPGFSMNQSAKLRMAHMLESLGVDVIEAGFPQASADDFAGVSKIAAALRHTTTCALARCVPDDIDSAARALEKARHARIHVFISTSALHREHKLGMSKAQVIDATVTGVVQARQRCHEVEFSAEDAMRTEPDFLVEVFAAAIEAGATIVNVPDTVGYMTPTEIAGRFTFLRERLARAEDIVFSCHCHDDLGLAVANSLAAVSAGAQQVECTVNGIGERAGNASLEELVMALKVRADHFGTDTRIDTRKLYPASRLLSELTGQPIHRNKAIVGDNAFAHESGIHQHGMLRHPGTYEIMRPEDVGMTQTRLVMGKHSGRAALRRRLHALGHTPDHVALDDIFARFKTLADKKREIHDDDLDALARGYDPDTCGPWRLVRLDISAHLDTGATVLVQLRHEDGREVTHSASGDGPVDAALRAIGHATDTSLLLSRFHIHAIGQGSDAQGQAHLAAQHANREWHGHGISTCIVEATAQAALVIINRIEQHLSATAPGTSSLAHPSRTTHLGT